MYFIENDHVAIISRNLFAVVQKLKNKKQIDAFSDK